MSAADIMCLLCSCVDAQLMEDDQMSSAMLCAALCTTDARLVMHNCLLEQTCVQCNAHLVMTEGQCMTACW